MSQNLRDDTAGPVASRATIVGALMALSISVAAAIVLTIQLVWRLASWAMVVRRVLGYP